MHRGSRRICEKACGNLHKDHEEHIAGKGINSLNHYSLVHKFIPKLQAMEIPEAKAAVEKEWEIWRKDPRSSWRKSDARKL